MSRLHEAFDAAQAAAAEHHCPACALAALEALSRDEVNAVIADAAHGVIHSDGPGKPSRREAAALGFSYGLLTGRALAHRKAGS